jgi:hypothetical protein
MIAGAPQTLDRAIHVDLSSPRRSPDDANPDFRRAQ